MKQKRKRLLVFVSIPAIVLGLLIWVLINTIYNLPKSPDNIDYRINDKIYQRNKAYAQGNTFGFTDKERSKTKPKGIYRIVVTGDSFIWGDGIPYENIWSHILERKITQKYDSIEILHWGLNGWSTMDEIDFLKQHVKDYGIDLLIIGWVDNDPDMKTSQQIHMQDPKKAYPILNTVWPALARKKVIENEQENYNEWLENLYRQENLRAYQKMLTDFSAYLATENIASIFVMTPSPFYDEMKTRFDTMQLLIERSHFKCLNLYRPAEKKLARFSPEELMANPVNGHPGVLMTEEFARETMDFLEINHYLPKKRKPPLSQKQL